MESTSRSGLSRAILNNEESSVHQLEELLKVIESTGTKISQTRVLEKKGRLTQKLEESLKAMDSARRAINEELLAEKERLIDRLEKLYLSQAQEQQVLEFLIDYKDMDATGKNAACYEQLERAVCQENVKLIEFLLDFGVDINARSKRKARRTVLFETIDNIQNPKILKLLLERGADPNVVDDGWYNYTPLEMAALVSDRREECEMLLKYGASFEIADKQKMLHHAARNIDEEMIKFLLNCDVNLNAKIEGSTALHSVFDGDAFSYSDEDCDCSGVIELLLDNGADINVTDFSETPLEFAVSLGKLRGARMMVVQAAKLKSLGSHVRKQIFTCIRKDTSLRQLLTDCESEIEDMKDQKIEGTTVCYFKVLKTTRLHELSKLAANEVILGEINSEDLKKKFSIYASTLKKCLAKGIERKLLLDRLASIFHCPRNAEGILLLPFSTVNSADQIYSYLSDKDLKNLAIAFHVERETKSCDDYHQRTKSKNSYLLSVVLFVLLGFLFYIVLIQFLNSHD